MRYIIQRRDGRYVAILPLTGLNPPRSYATGTDDAQDATDFKAPDKAENWIRENQPGGSVKILNDDGSWPVEW